jgi:hypothetical protein
MENLQDQEVAHHLVDEDDHQEDLHLENLVQIELTDHHLKNHQETEDGLMEDIEEDHHLVAHDEDHQEVAEEDDSKVHISMHQNLLTKQ